MRQPLIMCLFFANVVDGSGLFVVVGDSVAKAAADDEDEYRNHNHDEEEVEQTDNDDDADVNSLRAAADVHSGRSRLDAKPSRHASNAQSSNYRRIDCLINDDYSIPCRQDSNGEVYLPFKFIRKYFEVFAFHIFRSTSKSRPNNIRGGKCPSVRTSVRPSTKSFFDLNEIWYIGRGR